MKIAKIDTSLTLVFILSIIRSINSQGLTVTSAENRPGVSYTDGYVNSILLKLHLPSIPRVGEVFEAKFTIFCINDLEGIKFGPNYTVTFSSNAATIITGKEHNFSGFMKKGDVKQFKVKMKINKAVPTVSIGSAITSKKWPARDLVLVVFLIDSLTGQYGTKEEYEGKLPVEYKYDPLAGTFTCTPSQNPAPVEENRGIIKMMKELEPALSDSEALLLHSEQYRVGVPKGVPQWDSLNQRWVDKGVYEYYLKDGWYMALQEGKIEPWREQEKKKIESGWKGGRINFFRGDRDNNTLGDDPPADSFSKTFDGKWKFKDHLYNKDQGLLGDAVKKAINQVRARVLVSYFVGSTIRRLTRQCVTDSTGYFSVAMNVPDAFTLGRAYAIIYPCGGGSDTASPMISVSDPNNTQPSFVKDPLDSTLYAIRNMYYKDFNPNVTPVHFDSVYADTYPEVAQPQSGCINIYETYLSARIMLAPPPVRFSRIMWEPGYPEQTFMNMTDSLNSDTIWIRGDTVEFGTDEWDDDVLLHEFGHYIMKCYARVPPTDTGAHTWYDSFPNKKGIAYGEGWAHFFSCRARAGYSTDSLLVNTRKGINQGTIYNWKIIENPWLGSAFDTTEFAGGPWCEGAVAGALWDIYDSKNEIPYHSYPYPNFPDIALADTLSLGFAPIWNVFDNYDPAGTPTNCWTIFHFRSGWNYYNYDHAFALNQIFLHHRIRDSIPAKPVGLSAVQEGNAVRLYWRKNNEPDLKGYRLYRRGKQAFMIPPPPWGVWSVIAEKYSKTDTTHLDATVQNQYRYQYKVTAFDSLDNESPFSDSVEIVVIFGQGPDDISTCLSLPTIVAEQGAMTVTITGNCHDILIRVYDCCGRMMNKQKLLMKHKNAIEFDLVDTRGKPLPGGVYFLALETDNAARIIRKFVIVK